MKYRKLRIAWSVGWGILCLLLIVLWVRSYTIRDNLWWPGDDHGLQVNSLFGRIVVFIENRPPDAEFSPFKIGHDPVAGRYMTLFESDVLGFYVERSTTGQRLDLPHWFLVLLGMTSAAAPWWIEKWRFSLRNLLIGMTVVAVALGLIFSLSR